MGAGSARRSEAPRPPAAAVGRLRRLSLVPRDGARVVRGPGARGADERPVRQREGRPRGAAGRRRALHGGAACDGRARRLADDDVPHARRRAVLRRHLLAADAALGTAVVHASSQRGRRGVARQARRTRRTERRARRPSRRAGRAAGRRRSRARRSRARRRRADAHSRSGQRRPERRAEIPQRADLPLPVERIVPRPRAGSARRGARAARRALSRRHLRPSRRRLRPLFDRRRMARAAFREDALRQRADPRVARARRRRDADAGLRRTRARNLRLADARDARRRRVRRLARRRFRGRGGPLLRLERR